MAYRVGIVVEAHPEDHSIDVIMTDDFSRVTGVQVLSYGAGAARGTADLFAPAEKTGDEKWGMANRTAADQKVAIDFDGPMPIVLGFFYPQVGQMTFEENNRRIQRHSSDVYSSLDAEGNFELSFPNGSFLRVGTSQNHEDLTGKDFDGNWAISNNTGAATHMRLVLGNAGVVKADLHIDPSGNTTGTFQGTGNLTFVGDLTVHAPNVTVNADTAATINTVTATVTASTLVKLDTPTTHITGVLNVDGKITGLADLAITGTSMLTGAVTAVSSIAAVTLGVSGATTLNTATAGGKAIGGTHTHSGGTIVGHTGVPD